MEREKDRISQWLSSEQLEMIKHCSKPYGETGRKVGEDMNIHHRELRAWGFSHIDFKPETVALDIGCGGGDTISKLAELCPEGKIYGVDYSDEMVKLASEVNAANISSGRVEIKAGSVSELPFRNDSFDMVTAIETTYFWPDLKNDIGEVLRVMKKGALFVMINETYSHENFRDKNEELKRIINLQCHTPGEYESIFSEAGFMDIKIYTLEDRNWLTLTAFK